jgi:hypothetical protein
MIQSIKSMVGHLIVAGEGSYFFARSERALPGLRNLYVDEFSGLDSFLLILVLRIR